MKKQEFKEFLEILAEEDNVFMDSKDYHVFWKHFNKIARDIKSHPYAVSDLIEMTNYNEKEKIIFRNAMAREGVEFTPDQAKLYLLTLDIALASNGAF